MATNKNASIRYKILDTCFRNPGRNYFIEDLINACDDVLSEIDPNSKGISRRQIFDDISFMESSEGWSIDLIRTRFIRRVSYRYSDLSFSINNMPLNELEINHIRSAMNILSQFEGMPQFEWIHEILPKLKQGIETDKNLPEVISFDSNLYLKGIEHLGELYNAITYKKILIINYQPFSAEFPSEITIHPYYLKQFNNRWFLFGYNPAYEKSDWNMALDRMISIKEIPGNYQSNNSIDWNEYFEDIIGVTKPNDALVENIKLHFYGLTGKYIESKPIHGSQRSRWIDESTLEVDLQLIINQEFERFVLSYGEHIEVIQPLLFRNEIMAFISNAVDRYKTVR